MHIDQAKHLCLCYNYYILVADIYFSVKNSKFEVIYQSINNTKQKQPVAVKRPPPSKVESML